MKIFRGTQGLQFLLILGALTLPEFVVARSSDLKADLKDVSLVVKGTIQTIHSPLIPPGTAANPRPTPDLTLKVDLVVFGEFSFPTLETEKEVFDWPEKLVNYREGEHCVLFFWRAPDLRLYLHSVLPAGRDPWNKVDSMPGLKKLVKGHLLSQVEENPPSKKQAELINLLSRFSGPGDLGKFFNRYVASEDKFVRHAVIGELFCGNPSAQNMLLAQKDIESALLEKDYASIVVGTLSENGIDQLQYSVAYYDCLPGPIPKEKPFADLWRWIEKKDRELHTDSWPYVEEGGATNL